MYDMYIAGAVRLLIYVTANFECFWPFLSYKIRECIGF